jgi:hypothetical protein
MQIAGYFSSRRARITPYPGSGVGHRGWHQPDRGLREREIVAHLLIRWTVCTG